MDERAALALLGSELDPVGDDAAVVDGQVLTTDMLHETTDFPAGTSRYTAGWRAVGASLSDVAAMGAPASAAVAVYAAPAFDRHDLVSFVRGASDVCERVGAEYVGGDLDDHAEFTVATTALGRTDDPVRRGGAAPGESICITGSLGRSAAALRLFERAAGAECDDSQRGDPRKDDREESDLERANDLFRFEPRVAAGTAIAPHATAMMDSSDGLARSLHQLAEASGCGFAVDGDRVPIADALRGLEDDPLETATTFGEDFELLFAAPTDELETVRAAAPIPVTDIGTVREEGITLDGEPLADRGYTHG